MYKKEVIKKCEDFTELVKKVFKVKMVILYGSYIRKKQRKDSDIDIAIFIDKIKGDFLQSEANLYKISLEVDTKLEPNLYEINDIKNDNGFIEEILKTGKIIYKEKGFNIL